MNRILFDVTRGHDGLEIVSCDLTRSEREIVDICKLRGYGADVFIAYMAETYINHVHAKEWRGQSGTQNGVWVSQVINRAPEHDQIWIGVVNTLIEGEDAPIDKVFKAWLKGELLIESFRTWPAFHEALSRRLESRVPQA